MRRPRHRHDARHVVRDQLEVNYLGPVALTKLVLPRMREAGAGTVLSAFVGMSLADTDGSRVLGATRGWVETAPN